MQHYKLFNWSTFITKKLFPALIILLCSWSDNEGWNNFL